MTHLDYLQDFIGTTIKHLEQVRSNGLKNDLSFTINCSDLEDFNYIDIRQSTKFKPIFDQLITANGPILYWFEIISNTETKKILESLNNYKDSDKPKATPALKQKIDYDSRVLYVGKVKGIFWGRLIQHLGFFKVNATQGLQLFYWAKDLSLDLKIHVLEFDKNMADIMPIIEYAFAKKLQPLIGKHK
ncbi:MAG TPA: hypothetical protein PL108_01290 [Sediminibacterium sp.]|jgi:hypothetical protein|nr:MAG: hypothetical protein BWY38_02839 [Ignavibacteria bacterium ADurb.Bin266]HPH36261.1 hypothetical protein [Sediminibacterium sp.]